MPNAPKISRTQARWVDLSMEKKAREGAKTHWVELGDSLPAANCRVGPLDGFTAAMGRVDCPRCLGAVQLRVDTMVRLSRGITTLPSQRAR